jgi:hypothetical protein
VRQNKRKFLLGRKPTKGRKLIKRRLRQSMFMTDSERYKLMIRELVDKNHFDGYADRFLEKFVKYINKKPISLPKMEGVVRQDIIDYVNDYHRWYLHLMTSSLTDFNALEREIETYRKRIIELERGNSSLFEPTYEQQIKDLRRRLDDIKRDRRYGWEVDSRDLENKLEIVEEKKGINDQELQRMKSENTASINTDRMRVINSRAKTETKNYLTVLSLINSFAQDIHEIFLKKLTVCNDFLETVFNKLEAWTNYKQRIQDLQQSKKDNVYIELYNRLYASRKSANSFDIREETTRIAETFSDEKTKIKNILVEICTVIKEKFTEISNSGVRLIDFIEAAIGRHITNALNAIQLQDFLDNDTMYKDFLKRFRDPMDFYKYVGTMILNIGQVLHPTAREFLLNYIRTVPLEDQSTFDTLKYISENQTVFVSAANEIQTISGITEELKQGFMTRLMQIFIERNQATYGIQLGFLKYELERISYRMGVLNNILSNYMPVTETEELITKLKNIQSESWDADYSSLMSFISRRTN